eukprot:8321443-Alexandrium_andersonii.AAC.1
MILLASQSPPADFEPARGAFGQGQGIRSESPSDSPCMVSAAPPIALTRAIYSIMHADASRASLAAAHWRGSPTCQPNGGIRSEEWIWRRNLKQPIVCVSPRGRHTRR